MRQGFLTGEQYEKVQDSLPDYLRPLFVTSYFTGVRLGELLAIEWTQIDWEQGFITLNAGETKTGYSRAGLHGAAVTTSLMRRIFSRRRN